MNQFLVFFIYGACATAVGTIAGVIIYILLLEARQMRRERATATYKREIVDFIDESNRLQRLAHEQLMRDTVDRRRMQGIN